MITRIGPSMTERRVPVEAPGDRGAREEQRPEAIREADGGRWVFASPTEYPGFQEQFGMLMLSFTSPPKELPLDLDSSTGNTAAKKIKMWLKTL